MTHCESLYCLKDILAKIPKIIQRKEEKGYFFTLLGANFGPITHPKAFFFKKKDYYKATFRDFIMLFRGNLWKMPQQIGVIL